MRIGYGLLPEDSLFNLVRELELEVLERTGARRGIRQPPHVTVKRPFEIDELEAHCALLDGFATRFAPLTARVMGPVTFGTDVFVLEVEADPTLRTMHDQLLEALEPFDVSPDTLEANAVRFHMTVALKDVPAAQRRTVRSILLDRCPAAFEARFSHIGLFLEESDGAWVIIRRQPLTGEPLLGTR